jgi:Flp pilus assembly protein TadG
MIKSLIRRILHRPLRDSRGSVMIEFGFAMPFLIMLMLGGVELGRYVLLHQKLDRTAMTVADLVARVTNVTPADLNTIFTATGLVMTPFSMGSQGAVVVSSVIEKSGSPFVKWQRSGGGTLTVTSDIGVQGANATLSDSALVDASDGIVVGETYYDYSPWFIDLIPSTRLHHIAIYRPRLADEVTCTGC